MSNEDTFNDDELADIVGGTAETPFALRPKGSHTHQVGAEEPALNLALHDDPDIDNLVAAEGDGAIDPLQMGAPVTLGHTGEGPGSASDVNLTLDNSVQLDSD